MDPLSVASASVTTALSRYTAGATAVASGAGDTIGNLTALGQAKVAVEASATVARASADMSKRLVDLLV